MGVYGFVSYSGRIYKGLGLPTLLALRRGGLRAGRPNHYCRRGKRIGVSGELRLRLQALGLVPEGIHLSEGHIP